jgi:DNA-binding PucR family transcriptional regulator
LLAGEPVDVQAMSSRLRYDLERDHLAFVVWHGGPENTGDEALATLERAALELAAAVADASSLIVPRARLVIAAWVGSPTHAAVRDLARLRLDVREFPSVLAAFGSGGQGVSGFRRSHNEAMHARRIARLTGRRPGFVTAWDDVALAAVASVDLELAQQFVASELGALADNDDQTSRLATTLRVYLDEGMSPRRAAQRLGVHENTIGNRIRVAQERLPRPIEERACELQVALRLVALARDGN